MSTATMDLVALADRIVERTTSQLNSLGDSYAESLSSSSSSSSTTSSSSMPEVELLRAEPFRLGGGGDHDLLVIDKDIVARENCGAALHQDEINAVGLNRADSAVSVLSSTSAAPDDHSAPMIERSTTDLKREEEEENTEEEDSDSTETAASDTTEDASDTTEDASGSTEDATSLNKDETLSTLDETVVTLNRILPQISVECPSPYASHKCCNQSLQHEEEVDINQNDSSTVSSFSSSSRLFQKRRKKSVSEVILPRSDCDSPTSTTKSLRSLNLVSSATKCDSPGSKSVKSLNALAVTGRQNSASKSWLLSNFGSKKRNKSGSSLNPNPKKKSLAALFDAAKVTSDISTSVVAIPRANSASEHHLNSSFRRRGDKNDADENDVASLHLTRLATSDLRNLELKYYDKWRSPTASANSTMRALSPHNRKSLSSEDVSALNDLDECNMSDSRQSPHPQAYFTIDSRRLASKHKRSLRDKKLLYGVKQFNLDPKKGMKVLQESGFLPAPTLSSSSPEDPTSAAFTAAAKSTALFLFREGRLSKRQIGAFIGGHDDFSRAVLTEFVACHEFMHLILVQALRQFLWSFRLPGEAMQIDRVMDCFASRYCDQNPNLFDERDTCYILSFSIIMLNTALHNPNVKGRRITIDEFILQNRGINSGKDLPKDILELIYRSIKEQPFKIPDETYDDLMYTFFSPEKEGWLLKQGGSWKNWKRRWFVLSDRCLYYFQHTAENVPKGIIPLENVKVRLIDDVDSKSFCFELYSESNPLVKGCKTDSKGTVVQGNHKSYKMSASSLEERALWLQCIADGIKDHPFHDIVTAKKSALRRKNTIKMAAADGGTPRGTPKGTPQKAKTPLKKN